MDSIREILCEVWPLFGLIIHTPRLELILPTEREVVQLAHVAREGVHKPGWVPMGGWTLLPTPQLERGMMQRHYRLKAEWEPENWNLPLAVYLGGQPIGQQDLFAKDFGPCRVATSGSWLGYKFHGNGYGTEMRQAIAWFAFEVLGAQALWSDYWHDNEPTKGVSRKLGYRVMFDKTHLRDQLDSKERKPDLSYEVRLKPEHWNRPEYPIEVTGFEPCRELLGLN